MAEVHTVKEIKPLVAPFDTSRIRDIDNSGVPWGQLSHTSQFDVPAVGSGDTGKLTCYMLVPNNYWLKLAGFHVDMRSTSTPEWNEGIFVNFFTGQNSLSSGYSYQKIAFPTAVTSEASIGSNQYKNVSIASGSSGGMSAYDVNSPTNYLFKGVIDEAYVCPQFQLYNTTTGVHTTTFRVSTIWKMYDLSQGNHPWLAPTK